MVVKYTLKTPISWGENETITELTVRRPTPAISEALN